MAELNVWVDSYENIYSGFGSCHYLKRRIHDDFAKLKKEQNFYRELSEMHIHNTSS